VGLAQQEVPLDANGIFKEKKKKKKRKKEPEQKAHCVREKDTCSKKNQKRKEGTKCNKETLVPD